MATLATISARLLSDKGTARPMLTQGAAYRGAADQNVIWHSAVGRHLVLARTGSDSAGSVSQTTRDARKSAKRARASLRLEQDMHQRLKNHGTASRRTQQSILLQALEEYLSRQNEGQTLDGGRRLPTPG